MAIVRPFDAVSWIANNTVGGTHLSPDATAAVANFTMMWNLFEGMVCGNHANVPEFERITHRLDERQIASETLAELQDCLAFWTFRYRTPDGFADRFLDLNFRKGDKKEIVKEILEGLRTDFQGKAFSLMVIVYRLRNNLFHGLKTIEMLNDQIHNLNTASRCLGLLLMVSQSHLVRHVAIIPVQQQALN